LDWLDPQPTVIDMNESKRGMIGRDREILAGADDLVLAGLIENGIPARRA
jgi:hypothetical protein